MKLLIVEPYITGHHLEYLHHLYMMSFKMPQSKFIFVLPSSFEEARSMFDWPENKNVLFDTSLPVQVRNAKHSSLIGSFKKSIYYSKLTKKFFGKYSPDCLFSLDIMTLVPFLPFYIRKVKTVGIVYDIYLRKPDLNPRTKFASLCRFLSLSRSSIFQRVFILNDGRSADELNQIFDTKKFKYLPDPYVPIKSTNNDFRAQYGIDERSVVFAHFGSMTRRKGTLDIINVMSELSLEECSKYVFVFAGKVNDEIKAEFYEGVERNKNRVKMIIEDSFCSYDYLASLCSASNAILTPYHETCKSSGLIGYASQFRVPVIAYEGGLLGELITRYKLGTFINSNHSMRDAFQMVAQNQVMPPPIDYCIENCVDNFTDTIKKAFDNKK